jgi:hypothetical protein
MRSHNHKRVTEDGRLLGKYSALIAEKGRSTLVLLGLSAVIGPSLRPDMCKSCACRPGTVPNGCAQTQLDFLKAVAEGLPFLCHSPHDGKLCHGWVRARAAIAVHPLPSEILDLVSRYEYSPPETEE